MFGLTFEKLLLVTLVAGVVIGPQRLPLYARRLAETVRGVRHLLETTRTTAEAEMGVSLQRSYWTALDLRQYDPRRIVRDVLEEVPPGTSAVPAPRTQGAEPLPPADGAHADTNAEAALSDEASRVRPGQRYLVTGSAAHPRRIRIDSLPVDDPRRIAAYRETRDDEDHAEQPGTTPTSGDDSDAMILTPVTGNATAGYTGALTVKGRAV